MNTDLTAKQQTSEAIREAETILVTSGQFPSNDQICATLGLTLILKKFGKQVTGLISDTLPKSLSFLPVDELKKSLGGAPAATQSAAPTEAADDGADLILEVEKAKVAGLKYELVDDKLQVFLMPKQSLSVQDITIKKAPSAASAPTPAAAPSSTGTDFDLIIVVGVPTKARIDRVFEAHKELEGLPLVNLDFHRSNDGYGGINYIDPNAASLCEILVSISESLQAGLINEPIATVLLTGIVASTDRFTATHTSAKAMTIAAQMIAAGAKQQTVVQHLYRGGKEQERRGHGDRKPHHSSARPEKKPEPKAEQGS